MVLGAPLHQAPKETPRWNDKRKYHTGIRQTHYNMLLTAQKLRPNWGVALLDGYEGMEGNGPSSGTPVPSRIAIASTDYIAADRVGVECMGINPAWPGYLNYCGQLGLGNYDIAQDRRHRRKDRRRAEEVSDARGHRARTAVDGRNERSSHQAGIGFRPLRAGARPEQWLTSPRPARRPGSRTRQGSVPCGKCTRGPGTYR